MSSFAQLVDDLSKEIHHHTLELNELKIKIKCGRVDTMEEVTKELDKMINGSVSEMSKILKGD